MDELRGVKMPAIDVFAKVSDHLIDGMMMHEQMADYHNFLGLDGFKRLHEHHFFCETISMRRIHRYFVDHCNQLLPVANTKHIDAIPVEWSNFTRQAVESETKSKAASNVDYAALMGVLDNHMSRIKAVCPKEYDAVMSQIHALR